MTSGRCGTSSRQLSRPGLSTGASTSRKLRPVSFVRIRKRPPWWSSSYSWSCTRAATRRQAARGSAAGSRRASEVVWLETASTSQALLRVRPT